MHDELVKRLKEDKSWVEQGTTQTEHEIAEHIQQAADAIEELTGFVQEAERDRDEYRERLDKTNDTIDKLQNALLLMVLQYCTTNDGLLYHSFMSAGENAFAVLGLKNGQRVDLLWDKVFNQKPPKEESR